jgi:ATP-dependent DNA helicase RecQ
MNSNEIDIHKELKKYFGFSQFKGLQEQVIESLLNKQNTFVIMPTGGGKSLCYQLPALVQEGTAIVVSPLIALMKNQVDQMQALGIEACFLNSSLLKSERDQIIADVLAGKVKQLYVAPEALSKKGNIEFFKSANLSFVAVDEVHCVSEWGHDFRPEYRKIRSLLADINSQLPIIALTATATEKVQLDIQHNLKLETAKVFQTSFYRDNLHYAVLPKSNAKKNLVKFVQRRGKLTGIVYCLSRKKVEEIAAFLRVNDINALPYHAGLDKETRTRNQEQFLGDKIDVIVATIAFGMGIDKPNVRYVIHYDAPKSLEGYYQETGRAGRDGRSADCLLFYSYKDVIKLEKFNRDKTPEDRAKAIMLLDEVSGYAETADCRSQDLLQYFGEHLENKCGHCDNCKEPKEQFDAQLELLFLLNYISKASKKRSPKGVVKHVDQRASEVEVFNEYSSHFWASMVRQALLGEFLKKENEYVVLAQKGILFIDKPKETKLFKDREFPLINEEDVESMQCEDDLDVNPELLGQLEELREKVASRKNIPPYVVFQDASLEEMASSFPLTLEDLTHINGVGLGKSQKFGKEFVELIKSFTEEHQLESTANIFVKTSVNKSKNKIKIIQGIDAKTDLEELADNQGISFSELIVEMEHIIHSGTRLAIDYYLDSFMDEESVDDIYEYFMGIPSDDFELAQEELGEEYSDEEIKLVHIKFISEVAN